MSHRCGRTIRRYVSGSSRYGFRTANSRRCEINAAALASKASRAIDTASTAAASVRILASAFSRSRRNLQAAKYCSPATYTRKLDVDTDKTRPNGVAIHVGSPSSFSTPAMNTHSEVARTTNRRPSRTAPVSPNGVFLSRMSATTATRNMGMICATAAQVWGFTGEGYRPASGALS